MTPEKLQDIVIMRKRWYAKPNDLIGGWCVMYVDETPAVSGLPEVAGFTTERMATHIAYLHNNWVDEMNELQEKIMEDCRRDERCKSVH